MHEKLFSIEIFQYFCQILPRVCTLVLFNIVVMHSVFEVFHFICSSGRSYKDVSLLVDAIFVCDI